MKTLEKFAFAFSSLAGLLLLGSAAPSPGAAGSAAGVDTAPASVIAANSVSPPPPAPIEPQAPPPPPPPPTAEEALEDGVLIVVSIPSQQLLVLKDGELWDSSEVSTGKRGNETPTGTFPLLQKKVLHHSNLYDNAPMPYMQRLTWDGVALHAGRVPGYPASHGCVRLPKAFAKKLYGITGFSSTVVIVTDEEVQSAREARKLV